MRKLAGIVLAAALLVGTSACGGDDDNGGDNVDVPTEQGNLKPEDVRAAPAEVAEGFRELNRYADDVVDKLGTDEGAAAELQERLLTIWESILGAVKANDEAAYQELDDALKVLMAAKGPDRADAEEAAATIEDTSEAYLEKFPASGSPSSGSPSPSAGASSEDDESGSEDGADNGSDVRSDADPPISY